MNLFINSISRLDLSGDLGLGVGDLDAELLSASNDVDSLPGRDVVGDPVKWMLATMISCSSTCPSFEKMSYGKTI